MLTESLASMADVNVKELVESLNFAQKVERSLALHQICRETLADMHYNDMEDLRRDITAALNRMEINEYIESLNIDDLGGDDDAHAAEY